jgi:hypothetical protein
MRILNHWINTVTTPGCSRCFYRCHPFELSKGARGTCVSTYARTKVSPELKQSYVSCGRLSLTPLCYLWQRDQAELLSEMIDTGMEAVLIKVAGIGLKPSHLGKTLTEMQPTLFKLVITFPDIKMVD